MKLMQLALSLSLFGFTFGACNDENPQVQTSKQELLASDNSLKTLPPGYEILCNIDRSQYLPVMSPPGIRLYKDEASYSGFEKYEEAVERAWQQYEFDKTYSGPNPDTTLWQSCDSSGNVMSDTTTDEIPTEGRRDTAGFMDIDSLSATGDEIEIEISSDSIFPSHEDSTELVWLSMVIDDTTINTSNENYPGSMVKEKLDQGMLPVLKHVKDRHWQVVFEFPSQNIPSTGDIPRWVSPVESKLLDSLRANTRNLK